MRRREVRETLAELVDASDYAAWCEAAQELDRVTGMSVWRDEDESAWYDAKLLREDLASLRELRATGRLLEAVPLLLESLHRHLGDVGTPALYEQAWGGTKRLVETYLVEVCQAFMALARADLPGISTAHKLASFERHARNLGRTALLLSGGATLGFVHMGVVKALHESRMLPGVMSGASMGAMVAAGVCSRTDEEVDTLLAHPRDVERVGLSMLTPRQMLSERALLDPAVMLATIRKNCGDLTFEEAFQHSGRVLNISVSPTRQGQKPRILNHLTAPNLMIPEAAMASSSIPGIFPPAVLVKRDVDGQRRPFVPSERWIDGSMHGDLPKRRMARLHNVNHFVVSQTNPHVLPFLSDRRTRGPIRKALGLGGKAVHGQTRSVMELLSQLSSNTPLAPVTELAYQLVGQDYLGDIDIHPHFRPGMLAKMMRNPNWEDLQSFIRMGELATWPHIERIRLTTMVERTLNAAIEELRAELTAPRSTAPASGI